MRVRSREIVGYLRISLDPATFPPIEIIVYDWQDRPLEDHQLEDLELNVGLTGPA
ncbi:MAG: hypothetical protein JSV26_12395 [bacterium]|nr:MAG: hypothetical protein JSV26_12395 [bacterium]